MLSIKGVDAMALFKRINPAVNVMYPPALFTRLGAGYIWVTKVADYLALSDNVWPLQHIARKLNARVLKHFSR